MSGVLKKSKEASVQDLIAALDKFMKLLLAQKETAAVADLQKISAQLSKSQPSDQSFQKALEDLLECYDGEHELRAYTLRRKKQDDDWTEAEELYLASIEVLNLIQRLIQK